MFQCISMCLNVFIKNIIGISPLHSHCNIFAIRTHLYIFFHSIQWLPSQYAIPLYSFFPFLMIRSNFHTIYPYISCLYIIPHSTFHVIIGCAEDSKAQVLKVQMVSTCFSASSTYKIYYFYKNIKTSIFGGVSKFLKLIVFEQILAILGKFNY